MDYFDLDALLALGIAPDTAAALLATSPLTEHDGRAVIEAERLRELLATHTDQQSK